MICILNQTLVLIFNSGTLATLTPNITKSALQIISVVLKMRCLSFIPANIEYELYHHISQISGTGL